MSLADRHFAMLTLKAPRHGLRVPVPATSEEAQLLLATHTPLLNRDQPAGSFSKLFDTMVAAEARFLEQRVKDAVRSCVRQPQSGWMQIGFLFAPGVLDYLQVTEDQRDLYAKVPDRRFIVRTNQAYDESMTVQIKTRGGGATQTLAVPPLDIKLQRKPLGTTFELVVFIREKNKTGLAAAAVIGADGSASFTGPGQKLAQPLLEALNGDAVDVMAQLGKACGSCMWCGKTLSDPASQAAGVGAICLKRYGPRIRIGQVTPNAAVVRNVDMAGAASAAAANVVSGAGVPAVVIKTAASCSSGITIPPAVYAASPLLQNLHEAGEGEVIAPLLDAQMQIDADLLAQMEQFLTEGHLPARTAEAYAAFHWMAVDSTHLSALLSALALRINTEFM